MGGVHVARDVVGMKGWIRSPEMSLWWGPALVHNAVPARRLCDLGE
jgi:hypothetical protein